MGDPLVVRGGKGICESHTDIRDLVCRQRRSRQSPVETFAIDVFHRDEVNSVRLANVVDMGNARVIEGRSRPRLVFKAPETILALGTLWRQRFQRDFAAEPGIFGQPHLSHPTLTELVGDPKVRKRGADHLDFPPGSEPGLLFRG